MTVLLSITRPLGRVMVFADAVAKGDINARAAGTFTAEMAELNASIEAMLETLKGKIAEADNKTAEAAEGTRLAKQATEEANAAKAQAEQAKTEGMMQAAVQLEQVVQVVGTASKDLSSQIRQSSKGTEVQSQRVAETATAMEEMNATVLEVAKSAAQASDSSNEARQKALEGAGVVAEVVAGISSVQTVSLVMKDDMLVLGKQADGIGTIMNVISDIADQTNLLALNAAIEAARAGDAGRGFAVVADEVRKLAEKTMVATQEVGQAISGIQQGTTKNLQNVERAVGSIEQATSLANKSGEALQEIVRLVEVSSDQVRSIATASEQQSAASEEINHSIEEINRISSETAGSMAQSSRSVADLSTQVDNLRRLIDTMKRGG
jgi:methyl-accepting chemotaxis protein